MSHHFGQPTVAKEFCLTLMSLYGSTLTGGPFLSPFMVMRGRETTSRAVQSSGCG
jgi:hypothetical protein